MGGIATVSWSGPVSGSTGSGSVLSSTRGGTSSRVTSAGAYPFADLCGLGLDVTVGGAPGWPSLFLYSSRQPLVVVPNEREHRLC